MEEYPELEYFETGKMEMILELLKRDANAFFAPPATEHDRRECYDHLKALAMPHEVPPDHPVQKDHTYFLKRYNGFAWNDIELFSADAEYEACPGYKLPEIVNINMDIYHSILDFDIDADWCNRYLYIGRTTNSFFLWDDDEGTWEVGDRKTGKATAVYDNFYTFFATEIGGCIKLAPNEPEAKPHTNEPINETTEPGIIQHCKKFMETVDAEYIEKYGQTKKEWFEDYKRDRERDREKEEIDKIIKEKGAYVFNIDMTQPDSVEKMYQKGKQLLSYGYGDVAVPLLQMAADRGHTEAQYELANHLYNSQGDDDLFPHNKDAIELYRKAAEGGKAEAQYVYGLYCKDDLMGIDNPNKDIAKAKDMFEKSAEQGFWGGQFELGELYFDGNGVPQDQAKGVQLWKAAAEQGHMLAQNNMGYAYQNGKGVTQDYAKAFEWYGKAIDYGCAGSMRHMGEMYRDGLGVKKDVAQAKEWFKKAVAAGSEKAKVDLAELNVKKDKYYSEGDGDIADFYDDEDNSDYDPNAREIMLEYYYYGDKKKYYKKKTEYPCSDARMKIRISIEQRPNRAKYFVEWGTAFDLDDDGEGKKHLGIIGSDEFDQLFDEIASLDIQKDVVGNRIDSTENKGSFYLTIRDGYRYMYFRLPLYNDADIQGRGIEKINSIVNNILDLTRCKIKKADFIPKNMVEIADEDEEEVFRRIMLSFKRDEIHYNIQLFPQGETHVKCTTRQYGRGLQLSERASYIQQVMSDNMTTHESEKIIEGGYYQKLKEQLIRLNVKELADDQYKEENKPEHPLQIAVDIIDDFDSFSFTFERVSKDNIKKRKLEGVCAIARRILEISDDVQNTAFADLDDILRK